MRLAGVIAPDCALSNHGYSLWLTSPFLLNESDIVGSKSSYRLSSANNPDQDDHDSDDQKNMDETAYGVGRDQPQEPQNEQNNSDSP